MKRCVEQLGADSKKSSCLSQSVQGSSAMGDEARKRMDEVKFRNTGGNMEEIPGFNLTYNDNFVAPEEEAMPIGFPMMARHPPVPPTICQRVAARHQQYISGTRKHDEVFRAAAARGDGKALRAKDGKVLQVPYKLRLKSSR